jgi:type II secretory pathway pseudopilin PulG
LTLIEVAAGVMILSTLLVATLVAFQQHVRQARRAQRVLHAVAAADNLLGAWFAVGEAVPRQTSGVVPDDTSLSWRTTAAQAANSDLPGIEVVRLEINDEPMGRDAKPWVSVEVLAGKPIVRDADAAK